MKKKFVTTALLVLVASSGGTLSLASEQYSTPAKTSVSEGSFDVILPKGNLSFGEIKPITNTFGHTKQVIYPQINHKDFVFGQSSGQDYDAHNPYDPNHESITSPGTVKEMNSMLTIINSDFKMNKYQVSLSRTPFISENGKEMKGEHLFIGKFKDNGDFDKNIDAENKYSLAEFVTVTSENSIVATYEGNSAKGVHAISPLSKEDVYVGATSLQPNPPSYEEKNIQLVTDELTVIPESGNYTASLIWTISSTP